MSEGEQRFLVADDEAHLRLDHLLRARFPGWSRRRIARALDEGAVRVDGRRARKGEMIAAGAEVALARPPDTVENLAPAPEEGPLDVLHEDAAVAAVNKPAGVPTHPLRAAERGTLANLVVARWPECARASADVREGGCAHRLDAGTSGVVLVARTPEAYAALRDAFRAGRVAKEYVALVAGRIEAATISAALEPVPGEAGPLRVRPSPTGWRAETHVEPIETIGSFTLVRCRTGTGRMHQVRAHLASVGAPIAGDALYGGPSAPGPLRGFFLHASSLALDHPATGAPLAIEAPLPPDRRAALDELRR